jgi:leucyl/phenylalanyl-tRNA--protein transferase
MHFLSHKIEFPDVSEASAEGLLAVGGDLSSERLIHAYKKWDFSLV